MPEADDIDLGELYKLEDLMSVLYPKAPKDDLNLLWDRFTYTSPAMTI